jgi:hypothetical protein
MQALTLKLHSASPSAPVLSLELDTMPEQRLCGRCSITSPHHIDDVQIEGCFQRYSTPDHAEILIFLLGFHDGDATLTPALDIALRMQPDWVRGSGNFILDGIAVANATVQNVAPHAREW